MISCNCSFAASPQDIHLTGYSGGASPSPTVRSTASAIRSAGSLLPSRREAENCPPVCLFTVGEDNILPPNCGFLAMSKKFVWDIFPCSSRKVFERGRGGDLFSKRPPPHRPPTFRSRGQSVIRTARARLCLPVRRGGSWLGAAPTAQRYRPACPALRQPLPGWQTVPRQPSDRCD